MTDRQEANPSLPKLKRKTKTYESGQNPVVARTSYKKEDSAPNMNGIERRSYRGMDINQLDEQHEGIGQRRSTQGLNKSVTSSQGT